MSRTAAVIGGGISGLASAVRLTGLGLNVTLFEGEDHLGGLGTTFPFRDGHLERFYHCVLPNDDALIAHIRELGLEGDLLWRGTRMGFMYRGRTYPLNTPADLLRFSPLSIVERLRMGLMGIQARLSGLDPGLDGVTAETWIRGHVGDRAFEILWKPLLSAKIGDHYPALPALWLSSRMNREKNVKAEVKGCLRRGYRSLIDAFEARLRERGAAIRLRTRVAAIGREGERMTVAVEGAGTEAFDLVVATSPLPRFQHMTRGLGLPPAIADLSLDYQGVVSGVFLTRRPLSCYYWMPWVDSGATAQGAIEMSNLVPLERSHGLHVNYLVNYTHRDSALYRTPDDEMLALYQRDLERLYPEAAASVEERYLFRAPFVEPIWTVGYATRRPPTTVIPGRLYLACTAQVYPRVNSWNSCCEVVEDMMRELAPQVAEAAA
uniref:Oxidoreductase n=1 Tax=Eiseniibacteriota bacterium TaxID=2212470 RepID=A0A832MLT6_UNCEI